MNVNLGELFGKRQGLTICGREITSAIYKRDAKGTLVPVVPNFLEIAKKTPGLVKGYHDGATLTGVEARDAMAPFFDNTDPGRVEVTPQSSAEDVDRALGVYSDSTLQACEQVLQTKVDMTRPIFYEPVARNMEAAIALFQLHEAARVGTDLSPDIEMELRQKAAAPFLLRAEADLNRLRELGIHATREDLEKIPGGDPLAEEVRGLKVAVMKDDKANLFEQDYNDSDRAAVAALRTEGKSTTVASSLDGEIDTLQVQASLQKMEIVTDHLLYFGATTDTQTPPPAVQA